MHKYVAYYRVSTQRQGQSGLGLEAQRKAVNSHVQARGEVIAEYTEVESGRRADRPQLALALAMCKSKKATLVIAKLDRLARNVHFLSGLMAQGVEFVACDMPSANKMTLHILAAVAEGEADMISKRIKEALAAAKARGVQLGRRDINAEAGRRGTATVKRNAEKRWEVILENVAETLKGHEDLTIREKAELLTRRGVRPPRGGIWHLGMTHRALMKLKRR